MPHPFWAHGVPSAAGGDALSVTFLWADFSSPSASAVYCTRPTSVFVCLNRTFARANQKTGCVAWRAALQTHRARFCKMLSRHASQPSRFFPITSMVWGAAETPVLGQCRPTSEAKSGRCLRQHIGRRRLPSACPPPPQLLLLLPGLEKGEGGLGEEVQSRGDLRASGSGPHLARCLGARGHLGLALC